MQKLLVLGIILILPAVLYFYMTRDDIADVPKGGEQGSLTVRVGNVPIYVEVADTPASRVQGLSNRDSLGANSGMLFIFDRADYHRIWMKDMRFPIDVIWIGSDLKVVDITEQLRPDTFPREFEPVTPARFVIEVNANFAASFGIQVGDTVALPRAISVSE